MSQFHRRILTSAMAALEKEEAAYFADVADKLSEDPRTERVPNMVYLVLADSVRHLPTYLPKKELIGHLFKFVFGNLNRLQRVIYNPAFIGDKSLLAPITSDFVAEVVAATLVHYEDGKIESGERKALRLTFDEDGGAIDFPYADLDDENDA